MIIEIHSSTLVTSINIPQVCHPINASHCCHLFLLHAHLFALYFFPSDLISHCRPSWQPIPLCHLEHQYTVENKTNTKLHGISIFTECSLLLVLNNFCFLSLKDTNVLTNILTYWRYFILSLCINREMRMMREGREKQVQHFSDYFFSFKSIHFHAHAKALL